MYSVPTRAPDAHSRNPWAMNSGPLSLRRYSGLPRSLTTRSSTSTACRAVIPRPTSNARHSRVHSSTNVNHFSGRPSVVRS